MGWLRGGLPPHQTGLAMIGARAGDRVLVVGAGDAALAAEVARLTGLNGRTLVVDRPDARDRVERAAADAGALVDFEPMTDASLPAAAESIDIVVVERSGTTSAWDRAAAMEALRVLRPGGRVVVRQPAARGRLFGGPATPDPAVLDALNRAGAVAVRHLADSGGIAYFEARKPRD